LCQLATPDQVVGVIMPCHSDPRDESDARLVADHFGVPTLRIDLSRRSRSSLRRPAPFDGLLPRITRPA
jgi:hypothetical protein